MKTEIRVEVIEVGDDFPEPGSGGHLHIKMSKVLDDGQANWELPGVVAFEFGVMVARAVQQLEDERETLPV